MIKVSSEFVPELNDMYLVLPNNIYINIKKQTIGKIRPATSMIDDISKSDEKIEQLADMAIKQDRIDILSELGMFDLKISLTMSGLKLYSIWPNNNQN